VVTKPIKVENICGCLLEVLNFFITDKEVLIVQKLQYELRLLSL